MQNQQHIAQFTGKLINAYLVPSVTGDDDNTMVSGTLTEVTGFGVLILNQGTTGASATQNFRGRFYTWQAIAYLDLSAAISAQVAA